MKNYFELYDKINSRLYKSLSKDFKCDVDFNTQFFEKIDRIFGEFFDIKIVDEYSSTTDPYREMIKELYCNLINEFWGDMYDAVH